MQRQDAADCDPTAEEPTRSDDEFLLETDREYVLREDGWSARDYVAPAAFGVLLAALVGDAAAVAGAAAVGRSPTAVLAPVLDTVGLAGLVVLKAGAAAALVALPGVTDGRRSPLRTAAVALLVLGLTTVGSALSVLALA